MAEKDYQVAMELKKRLSSQVRLVDLNVLDSQSRGEATENSALDVFIEVDELDEGVKKKIMDIVWEVGYQNFLVITPLIFTREELENSPLRPSPSAKVIA